MLEVGNGGAKFLRCLLEIMLPAFEQNIVGQDVVRVTLRNPIVLVLGQLDRQRLDNLAGDRVLQAEDVLQPWMSPSGFSITSPRCTPIRNRNRESRVASTDAASSRR